MTDLLALRRRLDKIDADGREKHLAKLSGEELQHLSGQWEFQARRKQLDPEGDWFAWLVLAGRGFGKTRAGTEWIHHRVRHGARRVALVGRTAADVRDVLVDGVSGILATARDGERPRYEPSKRRLTWPCGATATTYSGDEPDQLRGPEHDTALADELAAWQRAPAAWSNLLLGLRIGKPRVMVTTTPRPIKIIRELALQPTTHVTRGSTYDNRAHLAPEALAELERLYAGTRLGRQELGGEILDDAPGALFSRDRIDALRVTEHPPLVRVVVAVDPAVSSGEDSDETGIVVVGIGTDMQGYVLEDCSGRYAPEHWARLVVEAAQRHGATVVAEINMGGDLVTHTIRSYRDAQDRKAGATIPVRTVRAKVGKSVRAEPVSLLYEQGRVHHVGLFAHLEDQLATWEPGRASPDRLDALVYAVLDALPLLQHGTADVPVVPPPRDAWAEGYRARLAATLRGEESEPDDDAFPLGPELR